MNTEPFIPFHILNFMCNHPGRIPAATLLLLIYLVPFVAAGQAIEPYRNPALPVEKRVADLLGRMTPEEKFWQLFMLTEPWDKSKDRYPAGVFGFQGGDPAKRPDAQIITPLSGGSALALAGRINAAQKFFRERMRLNIPILPFAEALHGLCQGEATSFPQAIGLAATFDTSLMHRVSKAIAEETHTCGIRMVLSPVVNIAEDPRWGRTEETYGEDPWLVSAMGVAFVSEFEKRGIITCPKHLVANSGQGGRDSYPVDHNERALEETYFPPFKACIHEGGSRSVMAAYNSLDGAPCTANRWLLMKKLKRDWNFKGFVISDASATGGSNCLHMTAHDYYESTVQAMNNGLDVIFQTDFDHYKLFQPPFLDGSVSTDAIDEAVSRVLTAKFQLGLFENPFTDTVPAGKSMGRPDHLALTRESARKAIVLLKNKDRSLPIPGTVKSVAVIGTDAVEARLGGYSGSGYQKVSILDGIRARFPHRVSYEPGCGRNSPSLVAVAPEFLSHDSPEGTLRGLTGNYFDNPRLEGQPKVIRTDDVVDFRWTLYSPDPSIPYDWFSVRWTGYLKTPETGMFRIGFEGNDGFRLYLDDQLVIDNWVKGSYGTRVADFAFVKDRKYRIRIEFFETSGSVRLRLVWNCGIKPDWKESIDRAVETARTCDYIIVVAGIEEGEGRDRAFLNLPGHQETMILELAGLGKPMAVVLVGGSAITMDRWLENVPAVLHCWYPGEQGGHAVADVLFGDFNPAGRLPITFPMVEGQLPLNYRHKPTGRNDDYADMTGEALFPFGFGLSYTSFEYSDLEPVSAGTGRSDTLRITLKVRNTGTVAGEEVVQLYLKDLYASVVRPQKELKGCQRILLKPGESRTVRFAITPDMLKMLDVNLNRILEPGDFRILIGASSKDIRLRGTLTVK